MAIFYTPLTDFLTKDTLPKEDPDKVILGADFSAEFNAISTAFAGAAPILNPNFDGTVTFIDATGESVTVTGAFTGGSLAISGDGTIGGNGTIDGTLTAGNTTVGTLNAGDTVVTGQLDVTGTITSEGTALPTLEDVQDIVSGAELAAISTLDDLADVNVSSVTDGQTIVWDNATGKWIPLTGNLFLDVDATSIKSDSFIETHAFTTGVMDCLTANNFTAILTAPAAFSFTNVPVVDGAYACTLKLTSAGNAVTWPAGTVWPTATPPTLSAGTDVFVFYTHDGGTTWYGFTSGQEIA